MFAANSGYKYSPQRMHIAYYKDGNFKGKESKSEWGERDMHMNWDNDARSFVKGTYYVIAEVDWLA